MASLSSFSEAPVLLQKPWLRVPGGRFGTRGSVDWVRFRGWGCGHFPFLLNVQHNGGSWRKLRARTVESDGGDGGRAGEDALQETIRKSKKVIDMQRKLLQQIAERKKLVDSIKNFSINPMDGEVSSGETVELSDLNPQSSGTGADSIGIENGASGSHINPVPEIDVENIAVVASDSINEMSNQLVKASSVTTVSAYIDPPQKIEELLNRKEILSSQSYGSLADGRGQPYKSSFFDDAALDEKLPETNDVDSTATDFLSTYEKQMLRSQLNGGLVDGNGWSNNSFHHNTASEEFAKTDDPTAHDVSESSSVAVDPMNVILVAAECTPWSKTGGLGDVTGALPKALARRGHRVMVVVPRYGDYAEAQNVGVIKRYKVDGQDFEVSYYQVYKDGVDFVFIDAAPFRGIAGDIYGGSRQDILKRMILFCKAAVEAPWHVPCGGICYGDGNLVFIANDWHTALLPVYLKAYYRDHGMMQYTRSVLVIHNIAHQGRSPVADFTIADLPDHYLESFRLYDPVGGEHANVFAGGLKAADRVVTVSHGYAWELKTPEGGWGLHNIINENDWKLRGIVNGIDTKEWSPQYDVHLQSDGYTNYSLETLGSGKAQCKEALQRELGLPVRADVPLIGFIGRLDGQKGVDLIADAVPWMMSQDVQLVMLGTGRDDLELILKHFESQYRDKARGWVGFSVRTAHRITAGADILLMPSRFEPCGLNQLYAMSYGTIPVVHAVGGLRDTVQPFDPFNETGLGWTFDRAESGKLIHALGNCVMTYRDYKMSWEGLQRRGMMQDLSWDHAAKYYEEVLVAAKYQW